MRTRALKQKPTKAAKSPAKSAQGKSKPAKASSNSKIDGLIALLQAPRGASLAAMMQASGWQAHSVRGAIAGAIKQRRGLNIVSEKIDGVRMYRVAP